MSDLRGRLQKTLETSAANTAVTLVAAIGDQWRRVVAVLVAYSAAPTQTGVEIIYNSGDGALYDVDIETGSANARYHVYIPAAPFFLAPGDSLDVVAPAAGGAITSSITIILE